MRAFFLPHFSTYYREHAGRLFQLIGEGKLHVAVDPTEFHGLDAVTDAVEYLHSGQSMGKVVVRLSEDVIGHDDLIHPKKTVHSDQRDDLAIKVQFFFQFA